MNRIRFSAVFSISILIALVTPIAWADGPIEQDVFLEFPDVNPCSGEEHILTFTGVARIVENQGNTIIVSRGTVETNDGFSGTFHWTEVFNRDQVVHQRFHDMEVNDAAGQGIVFSVGIFHETTVDGDPVVSMFRGSGARCVGPNKPK
jgi:hypothetical protein